MENNAEEVLPLQVTPIASAYNAKVREKELVFRIDRLLEELASLKEALLLKGKCSCFLVQLKILIHNVFCSFIKMLFREQVPVSIE